MQFNISYRVDHRTEEGVLLTVSDESITVDAANREEAVEQVFDRYSHLPHSVHIEKVDECDGGDLSQHRERADCGVRALAVACDVSYEAAYEALAEQGRKPCKGTYVHQLLKASKALGRPLKESRFTPGTTLASIGREVPSGRWLVFVSRHFAGVVDGEVVDWAAGRRKRVKRLFKAV